MEGCPWFGNPVSTENDDQTALGSRPNQTRRTMTIADLKAELIKNNIRETACLIEPSRVVDGALCLLRPGGDDWIVVLKERGEDLIRAKFSSEHLACRFVLEKVLMDPTYRKDFKQSDLYSWAKRRREIASEYGFSLKDLLDQPNR
jgi:hypothetical protein